MRFVAMILALVMSSVSFLGSAAAQQKAGPTITDDMQMLEGKWRTPAETPAKLEVAFKKAKGPTYSSYKSLEADIAYEGKVGKARCTGGCSCQIMEEENRRYFFFGPEILIVSSLPQTWFYRFEGKQLILTVEKGKFIGEYKLEKVAE
jgi:hypothetical protein